MLRFPSLPTSIDSPAPQIESMYSAWQRPFFNHRPNCLALYNLRCLQVANFPAPITCELQFLRNDCTRRNPDDCQSNRNPLGDSSLHGGSDSPPSWFRGVEVRSLQAGGASLRNRRCSCCGKTSRISTLNQPNNEIIHSCNYLTI